jgi:hypothetical protein
MFVSLQQSNGLSEFIKHGARIDACSCDALTSVASCYQCGSFGIVHRGLLQFVPQCFVKAGCYELASNGWSAASEARCYGDDSLLTKFL